LDLAKFVHSPRNVIDLIKEFVWLSKCKKYLESLNVLEKIFSISFLVNVRCLKTKYIFKYLNDISYLERKKIYIFKKAFLYVFFSLFFCEFLVLIINLIKIFKFGINNLGSAITAVGNCSIKI